MKDWKKIKEVIRKIGETIFTLFGIEDQYERLDHLEYKTSKFLDEREKDGIG